MAGSASIGATLDMVMQVQKTTCGARSIPPPVARSKHGPGAAVVRVRRGTSAAQAEGRVWTLHDAMSATVRHPRARA